MHKVFEYSYKDYLRQIVYPCFAMTILIPLLPYAITLVMNDSVWRVLIISMSSVLSTAILLYIAFLTSSEKIIVKQYIIKIINK